jgi:hypothetical protein
MSPLQTPAEPFKVTLEEDVVGTVEEFEEWTGDYGVNYSVVVFGGRGMVKLLEKKETFERQLKRLGLDIQSAMDQRVNLRFYRSPGSAPGKTWFNIARADATNTLQPAKAAAPAPSTKRFGGGNAAPAPSTAGVLASTGGVLPYPVGGSGAEKEMWAVRITEVVATLVAKSGKVTVMPAPELQVEDEDPF